MNTVAPIFSRKLSVVNSLWDKKIQNISSFERIESFDKVRELYTNSNSDKICNIIDDKPINGVDIIKTRIGSNSAAGEVYRININNVPIALKIMPIASSLDITKNTHEIDIATHLSNRVLSGNSMNFPIVYLDYTCKNIKLKKSSKFYNKSIIFSIQQKLQNIMNVDNVRELLHNYNKPTNANSMLNIANKILKNKNTELNINNIDSQCDILLSELANADLIWFFNEHFKHKQVLDDTIFLKIINDIINGIIDMQKDRIIHNDLHIGNILLLKKRNEYVFLLHDFGVSIINDDESPIWRNEEQLLDIERFIDNCNIYNIDEFNRELLSVKMSQFVDNLRIYISELISSNEQYPNCMELIKEWYNQYKTKEGGSYKTLKRNNNKKYKTKNITYKYR